MWKEEEEHHGTLPISMTVHAVPDENTQLKHYARFSWTPRIWRNFGEGEKQFISGIFTWPLGQYPILQRIMKVQFEINSKLPDLCIEGPLTFGICKDEYKHWLYLVCYHTAFFKLCDQRQGAMCTDICWCWESPGKPHVSNSGEGWAGSGEDDRSAGGSVW